MIYNVNTHVRVAVQTPVWKTKMGSIRIIQRDVLSLILRSKHVDTFGKERLEENKYIYQYKGEVDIPPLGMVDHLICVSECGHNTSMIHSYMILKTESKKLQ